MSARARTWARRGVIWLLFVVVAPSCQGAEHAASEQFLRKPMVERRTAILEYPPEQQVELYLRAMLAQHPPDLALADAVASNGERIVRALTRHLVEEDRDIAKMHLIDVFSRMQELDYYAVASDGETMDLLDRQVAAMKDPQWKGMASDMLERIRAKK